MACSSTAAARSSLLFLALVACSSSPDRATAANGRTDAGTTERPGGDASPSSQTLESQYAAAFCGIVLRCDGTNATPIFGDQNSCVAKRTATLQPRLHASGVGDLSAQVAMCAAALAARPCDGDYETTDPSCVLRGTLANGAACAYGTQCQTGSCVSAAPTECGVCTALAAAGEDCMHAACVPGTTCAATGTCKVYKKLDEECGTSTYCAPGLVCDAKGGAVTKCVNLGSAGDDCSKNGFCVDGYSCVNGTCAVNPVVMVGQACGIDVATGQKTSCSNGYCVGGDSAVDGTCTAWVAAGGACDDAGTTPLRCDDGLDCVDGKCVVISSPATCH